MDVELEMKARETYTSAELSVVAEWIRVVCGEKVPFHSSDFPGP